MKTHFTLTASLLWVASSLFSQTYNLTIQNGYAEVNQAAAGDTIHIWAEAWGAARTFDYWSGDTAFLEHPLEWHTRVVMPAHDVSIQSNTKILATGTNNPLTEESMMGRDRMKRVFSYFPAGAPPLGVCWLWHGTNGSASSWAGQEFEQHQFVKYLVSKGWGVIVSESDESTVGMDLNGDGELRYDYTPDSMISVDIANVRAIRDTFIHRGKMSWSTPQAAVGFSAGGAFSTLLASILGWQAAVTHCSPGAQIAIQNTKTPISISMNLRDNHPGVGSSGNLEGFNNWQYLTNKGLCSEFYMLRPSPTYPQRFQRMPGIGTGLSYSIHNELVANDCFAQGGFLSKSPSEIEASVIANPTNWPVALSLSNAQRQFVLDQLQVMWTAHHFHSDFMAADFAFISKPCGTSVGLKNPTQHRMLNLYPNPVSSEVFLPENAGQVRIFDLNGKLVLEKSNVGKVVNPADVTRIDVSTLPIGLYFLQTETGWGKFVRS